MSTDYGYRCETCEWDGVIDNLRSYSIPMLFDLLKNREIIEQVMSIDGLQVTPEYSHFSDFWPTIRKAFACHARGHKIVIVDEYGARHDQCHSQVACPCCGHQSKCDLTAEHQGPHETKKRGAP